METLVINLFAGPGTGKSTTCAGLFSQLKTNDINCEMALEYAKDLVWQKSTHIFDNQLYLFAKQHHRIWRLRNQVRVIVTDAPMLLSLVYGEGESEDFKRLVLSEHNKLWNLNVFLTREKVFNPKGRIHDEEQSKEIDQRVYDMLKQVNKQVPGSSFVVFPGNEATVPILRDFVLHLLETGPLTPTEQTEFLDTHLASIGYENLGPEQVLRCGSASSAQISD